ncbi:MAG: hypothetical protein AB7T10_06260 [bacterium]
MKRKGVLLLLAVLIGIIINAAQYPTIYVNGQKGEGCCLKKNYDWLGNFTGYSGGWTTWYPLDNNGNLKNSTVMTIIDSLNYDGYFLYRR